MKGSELRALREANGLTGKQLAQQLGVDPNTLYRWERDKLSISARVEAHIRLLLADRPKKKD